MATITPKKLTLEEIEKIIHNEQVDNFLGAIETEYFEFREKAYTPESPSDAKYKSQLELARDISSLANTGGGYICIGMVHEPVVSMNTEFVKSICGIKESAINLTSWMASLEEFLYPKFSSQYIQTGFIGKDVRIFWMKIPDAKKLGAYPILVVKDQFSPSSTAVIKGRILGLYERLGAKNDLISAADLHSFISTGMSSPQDQLFPPNLSESLYALHTKIDTVGTKLFQIAGESKKKEQPQYETITKEMCDYADTKLDYDIGYFYMSAIPEEQKTLEDFWETGEKSVYQLIKNPPRLRNFGWDLDVASSEYPNIANEAWEIQNGSRKLLKVNRDGSIFAAGTIDEFLDFGLKQDVQNVPNPSDKIRHINHYALVEYIDVFFHFLEMFRVSFGVKGNYTVIFGFRQNPIVELKLLVPSHINGLFAAESETPTKTQWKLLITEADSVPTENAGRAVGEIDAGFKWSGQDRGYIMKINGKRVVNEDHYRKKR